MKYLFLMLLVSSTSYAVSPNCPQKCLDYARGRIIACLREAQKLPNEELQVQSFQTCVKKLQQEAAYKKCDKVCRDKS